MLNESFKLYFHAYHIPVDRAAVFYNVFFYCQILITLCDNFLLQLDVLKMESMNSKRYYMELSFYERFRSDGFTVEFQDALILSENLGFDALIRSFFHLLFNYRI